MKRILVIDDASTMRSYYRSILEDAGYHVSEAVNGLDGLECALRSRFDLFLVDINMPIMDGLGFVRGLRTEFSDHVPALVVSTESVRHCEADILRAGADAYLIKPVRPAPLVDHVRRLTEAPAR